MPAIPALFIIFGVLWLLVRHPKRFVALWLVMLGIAIAFIASILFIAFYLPH
ncbi:hypothetical protein [Citrobacter werkmanii]|uniref:hypothetical protein n=1 Tax=Citrobacter werkmanii TaxID=67827 RepID=UPI002652C48B|nr:hypothetical protein [Citrobacter werkmanii]MDN8559091.1 hypothetical protein [Citrobacter werkmanii]